MSWGFSKLAPLFLPGGQRFLVLDSDIVFAGPVLELLESHDADFIVQHEEPAPGFVASNYFDLEKLRALDPEFVFPGFTFNTGQWVGTTGLVNRADFEPVLEWTGPVRKLHPDVFKFGEQGLFNYVLMKKTGRSEITLDRVRFMRVPGYNDCLPVRAAEWTLRARIVLFSIGVDKNGPVCATWRWPKCCCILNVSTIPGFFWAE